MTEKTIKIAMWNIYGPTAGKNYPASARKINAFQNEVKPDIAFYLEAPEGNMKDIDSRKWQGRPLWIGTGEKGNPRGILVVCCNSDIHIEQVSQPEPVTGRTALGIKVFSCGSGTEILRILGVWTTPGHKTNSQSVYLDTLKHILADYQAAGFFDCRKPCCTAVVGDTNVNLSSAADNEKITKVTPCCARNRKEFDDDGNENSFARKFSLFLCDVPSLDQNTLKKNGKWYRCDHLFVSDMNRIRTAELGSLVYMYDGKEAKSDHRPIIFEVSVPD